MQTQFLSRIPAYLKNHFFLIVFLAVGLFKFPLLIRYISSYLDSSWGIGTYMTFTHGLQYGVDNIFTYGLLGFLENPLLHDYALWEITVVFTVFVHFLFLVALYLLLRSFSARWYHFLLFIPILLLILSIMRPHWGLLLATSIFLYLFVINTRRSPLIYSCLVGIGLLLAINSFIKFDMMVNGIVLIGLFFILSYLINRKILDGILLAVSYAFSWIGIWAISGQYLSNIPAYIRAGLEITRGYAAAMSVSGPAWQVIMGLLVMGMFILFFFWFFIRKNKRALIFLVLNGLIIFSSFKSAFVRHDPSHIIDAIWVPMLFLAVLVVALDLRNKDDEQRNFSRGLAVAAVIFIIVIAVLISYTAPWTWQSNAITTSYSNNQAFGWILNRSEYEHQVDVNKKVVMNSYAIDPGVIWDIGNRPTDIIPWDIALAWAYSLNWSPRPVFQSNVAWSPYLDAADYRHETMEGHPEMIVFSHKSIDGRYPFYDEPLTFLGILNNYTYVNRSGEFVLLKWSQNSSQAPEEPLGSIKAIMGEAIPVPEYKGEIIGKLRISYSPLGELLNVVYKPAPLYISFKLKNGITTPRYRFIPATGGDGLLVSQYVGDQDTFARMMRGNLINDIESVTIETDHPEQYSDSIPVTFTGLPRTLMYENNLLLFHPIIFENVVHQETHPSYSFETVDGVEKVTLFEHPQTGGSVIRIENVSTDGKSRIRVALSLDPEVWSEEKGDGVEYRIYMNSLQDEDLIFSHYIDPKNNPEERKWNTYEVDIPSRTEGNSTFFLVTLPGPSNNPSYDWAWWGDMELQ